MRHAINFFTEDAYVLAIGAICLLSVCEDRFAHNSTWRGTIPVDASAQSEAPDVTDLDQYLSP